MNSGSRPVLERPVFERSLFRAVLTDTHFWIPSIVLILGIGLLVFLK